MLRAILELPKSLSFNFANIAKWDPVDKEWNNCLLEVSSQLLVNLVTYMKVMFIENMYTYTCQVLLAL